jgi:hypothetical protein
MWKYTGLCSLVKPRDLTDCLPPPRTLILDFTLTHTRFGKSQLSSLGQLTHTRRTDGAPEPDGALRTVVRTKIYHYRQLYINHPEPIAFMSVAVDTSGRIYEDFSRLLFLVVYRRIHYWTLAPNLSASVTTNTSPHRGKARVTVFLQWNLNAFTSRYRIFR